MSLVTPTLEGYAYLHQTRPFSSISAFCHTGRAQFFQTGVAGSRDLTESQIQMKCSRIAALLLLAMMAIVTAVPAAYAQSTVGTISQLQGTANILRGGSNIAAMQNMPVQLHDRIATDANSTLTVALVDNSSLDLGPSSTLTFDESVLINGVGAPSKVGLLSGHLHSAIVGAMRGSASTFQVNTPNAIGAVRGTEWDTDYDEDQHQGSSLCRKRTRVAVQEGTVLFCNEATPPECKEVHAGGHSEVRCAIFWQANTGLGAVGVGAVGAGLAGGIGVGIAAGAGAFNGPSGQSTPVSSSK